MIGTLPMLLPGKSISAPTDSLQTSYIRGLNSESWGGSLQFQKTFSNHYHIFISEFLSSSLLHFKPDEDKWKDQSDLTLLLSRDLSRFFSISLIGKSYFFSDKQTGYVNDIKNNVIGLGTTYINKNFQIPLQLGVIEDQRYERKDSGIQYQFGMNAPHFDLDEYINTFNMTYEMEDLEKRKNTTFTISYLVNRQFQPGTSDSLRLTSNQMRRDYYVSASGEIESREEKSQTAENSLIYRISNGLFCRIHGALSARQLHISRIENPGKEQNHEREDFNAYGAIDIDFKTSSSWSNISFNYAAQDQKYRVTKDGSALSVYSGLSLIKAPDNESAYTTLSFQSGWRFFSRDSLHLTAYLQRFRYDTPDPENYDDRDELRIQFALNEFHRFSSVLSMCIKCNVNLLHFVYIFGEKSADNNWTRIFRLNPEINWSPSPNWKWKQSVEVLANYISYDFESILPSIKSFLYRKFRLEESLESKVSQKLSFQLMYRLELDENGKFLWDDWMEQKLVDRYSHTFQLYLNYSLWNSLTIQPGYTYYSRKGYKYIPYNIFEIQKDIQIDFQNYGPSIAINYVSNRLRLNLTASKLATETLHLQKQILNRFNLKLSWAI
jgi:hypothetical protein